MTNYDNDAKYSMDSEMVILWKVKCDLSYILIFCWFQISIFDIMPPLQILKFIEAKDKRRFIRIHLKDNSAYVTLVCNDHGPMMKSTSFICIEEYLMNSNELITK